MIEVVRRHIPAFFLLCSLQILILNNLQLGGMVNPYLYVLFLISLPFETSRVTLMLLGFGLGLVIDIFTRTLGLNVAACVLMAYLREPVYRLFAPREGYDATVNPSAGSMGWGWLISVSAILVFIHHTALFVLEEFRFTSFFWTLAKIFLNTLFTLVMIVLAELFTYRAKSR